MKILLVDDDKDLRECVMDSLLDCGFEVVAASSGSEATQLLANVKVEAVITDLRMANEGGLKVLAEGMRLGIPCVVFTGLANVDPAEVPGAALTFVKGEVDIETVAAAVRTLVEEARAALPPLLNALRATTPAIAA